MKSIYNNMQPKSTLFEKLKNVDWITTASLLIASLGVTASAAELVNLYGRNSEALSRNALHCVVPIGKSMILSSGLDAPEGTEFNARIGDFWKQSDIVVRIVDGRPSVNSAGANPVVYITTQNGAQGNTDIQNLSNQFCDYVR